MNTEWLQDFLTLADTGNFTIAASKQNVSQAAFSRRIQALEAWVGVPLVNRQTHPIRFTADGLKFLEDANDLLVQLHDARTSLSNLEVGRNSHIKIVMPHALAKSRFVKWWRIWSADTKLSVTISIGNVAEVVAQFLAGNADILICHNGADMPLLLDPSNYMSYEMEKDRLSPYASTQVTQKYETRFPGTETHPLPLVRYTKGAYFARLVDLIITRAPNRLNCVTQIETDMSNILQDCVSAGFGIGWLPESAVQSEQTDFIRKLNVDGWSMDLTINAYMHKNTSGMAENLLWEKITQTRV